MSKKTHQRELERARAKRQATTYAQRQQKMRYVAIALVVAMAGGAFALAAISTSADDPDVAVDSFLYDTDGDGVPDSNVRPDEGDDTPATADGDPAAIPANACQNPSDGAPASPLKSYDAPPEMVIDAAKSYVATVETTCGTIVLELDAAMAPATVNNFVFLARDGYYDGAPFHRVIEGFMMQGGDPSGTGHGEGGTYPGYQFDDELELAQQTVDEFGSYTRGTLAMANSGANTNGSQFFIMHADYGLPPAYAVFGRATEGLDVVDQIVLGPAAGDQAIEPVRIISITIEER